MTEITIRPDPGKLGSETTAKMHEQRELPHLAAIHRLSHRQARMMLIAFYADVGAETWWRHHNRVVDDYPGDDEEEAL